MAIVEKNLGGDKLSTPRTSVDEAAPVAQKAVPRAAMELSDWDDVIRRSTTSEQERMPIPPELIPDGFSVEWKSVEILGKPNGPNISLVEAAGWRPAPAEWLKSVLPSNYTLPYIENGFGDRLYARPLRFTEQANKEQYNVATQKVKDYENATMNPVMAHKDVKSKVHAFSRSYEKVTVPD